jgi:hypothetical protein
MPVPLQDWALVVVPQSHCEDRTSKACQFGNDPEVAGPRGHAESNSDVRSMRHGSQHRRPCM